MFEVPTGVIYVDEKVFQYTAQTLRDKKDRDSQQLACELSPIATTY